MGRRKKEENADFTRTQIMTLKEAAKYLGIHPITAYRLIKKGEIPAFRIGGQWRIKKDLLDAWILSRVKQNTGASKDIIK